MCQRQKYIKQISPLRVHIVEVGQSSVLSFLVAIVMRETQNSQHRQEARASGIAQKVEHLPSKLHASSSTPQYHKTKQKKKKEKKKSKVISPKEGTG
jgi:hypothetical protein